MTATQNKNYRLPLPSNKCVLGTLSFMMLLSVGLITKYNSTVLDVLKGSLTIHTAGPTKAIVSSRRDIDVQKKAPDAVSSNVAQKFPQRLDTGTKRAYVTYNDSVVIQCLDSSPFVYCEGPPPPRSMEDKATDQKRHKPYTFSLVKKLGWTPEVNFKMCRYNNCVDAGNSFSQDTDVLGFNGNGLNDNYKRPPRNVGSNQRWLFAFWESPDNTRSIFVQRNTAIWNHAMNMTLSYRVDSDVFLPYGKLHFEPKPLEQRPNYFEIASKKKKMVAWFVSNCRTHSKRMDYVKKLQQYIEVDIFGGCGTPCPRRTKKCEMDLMDEYKFYLSFENSLCTDYVTEKFFKVFTPNTSVIPVVRGGADYEKYFPAGTFINAADFQSPRHLAEHLKSLGSDVKRYAQFLERKDMYQWNTRFEPMWCKLCEYLNTNTPRQQMVDLKKWWVDGHCHAPTDLR